MSPPPDRPSEEERQTSETEEAEEEAGDRGAARGSEGRPRGRTPREGGRGEHRSCEAGEEDVQVADEIMVIADSTLQGLALRHLPQEAARLTGIAGASLVCDHCATPNERRHVKKPESGVACGG